MGTDTNPLDVKVEVIADANDLTQSFDICCHSFGEQTKDVIFVGLNPGWDTPAGKAAGAARFAARFPATTTNLAGKPNTVFLKATVSDPSSSRSERVIAGMAIWMQVSVVPGHGNYPPDDEGPAMDVASIFPGDEAKQKLWGDVMTGMHAQRRQLAHDKAGASPPAIFVLDLCMVDPQFQGMGIARKLVQWGLDEAKERGDLEAVTEASVMGRRLYLKMGFEQEGPEIDYGVDETLVGMPLPSNIFLRTRNP